MHKVIDYMEKTQLVFGAIFLVFFVIATLLQVVTRYLSISATWTEEVAVNCFIWSMLLGAAVMVRRKQHFSFDILTNYFSEYKRQLLIILQDVIILAFCVLCVIYSAEITNTFWNSRWVTIPSLQQGYVWLILPVSFISMCIYLVEDIFQRVRILNHLREKK